MNSQVKKNYLFLGFAIPDEEMERVFSIDNSPQVQTHKFNWNLIRGLEHFDEFDFTYISARPVSDYPGFSQKRIKKNQWVVNVGNKRIEIYEIPFLNRGVFKLVTRFFSSLYYSFKNFHRKQNKAGVIVYSVHVPYMAVGLIIAKVFKIDYIAIWTDPPSVSTRRDSLLKSRLRTLELKISKYLMQKATKVIALTKYLAEDFAPGKPYLVMEGIIDLKDMNCSQKKEKKSFNQDPIRIIYTGSLAKRYGVKNIVEGFLSMSNQNAVLEIYGRGDFEDELLSIVNSNHNVIYKGFVNNKEIIKIQRKADFLINARSSEDDFVKYSFPSKTLEYMLSGTPLITTMLPGIPEEYKDYVIILDNNSTEAISTKLEEVLNYSHDNRCKIGSKALEFAKSKNYYNQGSRIIKFLKDPLC